MTGENLRECAGVRVPRVASSVERLMELARTADLLSSEKNTKPLTRAGLRDVQGQYAEKQSGRQRFS